MRIAKPISLSDEQRAKLISLSKSQTVEVRVACRARMILLAADGLQDKQIATQVNMQRQSVARWRDRFLQLGIDSLLKDLPRGGRTRTARSADKVQEIIRLTTQTKPPHATHWSTNSMARAANTSATTVGRVWKEHGLKPHLVESFKLSNDKQFAEKLTDVVGLYLNPPEHAIVLSCDEKSSIQALDRTQPSLPMKKGRCGTMTHDYKRHGTTTLFAALNMRDGKVIGTCMPRHRHQEWIRFLKEIDRKTPAGVALHLIVDNYATHKHAKVKSWLKRHPRFHMHFTPTSASWLNMVERYLRDITSNMLSRTAFRSVKELIEKIEAYLKQTNEHPKPFVWTAKANDILEKVKRARVAMKSSQQAGELH